LGYFSQLATGLNQQSSDTFFFKRDTGGVAGILFQ